MEKKIYTIDASGKILGRLAAEIAVFLRGKNDPKFLPYLEPKNEVVVFNIENIKVTGKKLTDKIYTHHTGYHGGLKQKSLGDTMAKDPQKVLREAVYGMLPKNKTRDKIIKNLKLHKKEIKHE